jgi:nucleoside-diphosphate-sugar epimerase
MRVFITGISGYAGYYAALRLASAGHEVTGLVRNPDHPRLDVLRVHEVKLVVGDVSAPDVYREHLERSGTIIHTMLDKKQPKQTDRALFEAISKLPQHAGTRRRFVYVTGCSIFGKTNVRVMDESTEPNPNHFLAFRRDLEKEALALENVGVVVLRPGFMYGNDGYNSQATDWFEMGEAGEGIYRGDREKSWSWIHIADLADAFLRVVEADRSIDGELFCLADDLQPFCRDVMRGCIEAAGYRGEIRFEGPLEGNNTSTWFDQNELMTSEKARRLLGWVPRHAGILEDIPAAYAAWKVARRLATQTA